MVKVGTMMEQAKRFFEKDYFAKACGIEIDAVAKGWASCSFEIKEKHLNAGKTVQGGAIFTLADFTFAVAANSVGKLTVSLENQITYMHRAEGKRLIAVAKQVSETKSLCFYEVIIADELGHKVAKMSVTGYMK